MPLSDELKAIDVTPITAWETSNESIALFLKQVLPDGKVYTESTGEVVDHPETVTIRAKETSPNGNYKGSLRTSLVHKHRVPTTGVDGEVSDADLTVRIEVVSPRGIVDPTAIADVLFKTASLVRYDEMKLALGYGQV